MATVHIQPLPEVYRTISRHWWPLFPPPFQNLQDGPITSADRQLARELFKELDPQSQDWYGHRGEGGLFAGL